MWAPLMNKMKPKSSASSLVSEVPSSNSLTRDRRCPQYKKILGTTFAVDAFNYGDIPGIKFYFLSHFHYDHYIGLTSKFKHVIYCSPITARLVHQQIKVSRNLLHTLELEETKNINGVMVTALDANHCPGSLMLLFQLGDGTTHLHTGDFRASPLMESYSAFWNIDVQKLFLDTTYCNERYNFPTQEEITNLAADLAEQYIALYPKCLIVCGSYTIGKEKVFIEVAERLNCKVWAPTSKFRILRLLEDKRVTSRLVTNSSSARVHVLPMGQLNVKSMGLHLAKHQSNFSHMLALRPSGWEQPSDPAKSYNLIQKGNIVLCGLPYSEHSSFSELKRFVKFLRPREIMPTVRVRGQSWTQVRTTCQNWLQADRPSAISASVGFSTQTSLDIWASTKQRNSNVY